MKYLLIFEDGTFKQADELPDKHDESIEAGILDIVRYRFSDGKFEARLAGKWNTVRL